MTDMKKILPLAALVLLASACTHFRTQVFEDDLVIPLADPPTDTLFYTASLEYVTGGATIPVQEKINTTILSQAFDLEEGLAGTLEETAVRYRENLIDEYLNENENRDFGPGSWEDRIDGSFTSNYKNWCNYLLTYYSYRGGAHGIQTVSNIVFDRKSGETLTEKDLFQEGYAPAIAAMLQESVTESFRKEAPELLELVDLPSVIPNGNFSVGGGGVEWTFQPYEVGPYALGIITAGATWEQLKPYLKK